MTLLVLGAGGQVGREVLELASEKGVAAIGLTRADLDITDGAAVHAALAQHRPSLVVNAAALTNVDQAEADPARAFHVNRDGPAHLAAAAAARGLPLLHLSTDYVFGGERPGAWREDDPTEPVNVYGHSKLAGEEAVRAATERHVILRSSWIFGPFGRNFFDTILRQAARAPELRIVADQRNCPTPGRDLAAAILHVAEHLAAGRPGFGTYHYCGVGAVTRLGFAEGVLSVAFRPYLPLLRPVPATAYPSAAPRPANTVLDCAKFATTFGLAPRPWRAGVALAVERWRGQGN
ncbi:MAG: dTDP-4-dehydrorhamnose reductase [Alphaproteobacteria bacterium]|nr:dTDP-4-dehydrorhamnose reductase [Alphaproteobacteria bacterium]